MHILKRLFEKSRPMKSYFGLCLFSVLVLVACSDEDLCVQRVSYTKAVGIYADLDPLRSDDLNGEPRLLRNPGKIYVSDQLILIGEEGEGIHVVDNSDPTSPSFINFLEIPGNREMFVMGNLLYADSYFDMLLVDISDPGNTRLTERLEEAFPPRLRDELNRPLIDFHLENVYEELACDVYIQEGSMVYFDFKGERIPESAIPTSFVASGSDQIGTVNRMAHVNDHLYVIGSHDLYVFEVSDNQLNRGSHHEYFSWEMETIYPMNDLLFVGSINRMNIYNTIQPLEPQFEGEFFHATSCDPVLPTPEEVAYVTLRSGNECPGDENTLNIIDISSVQNPRLITSIGLTSPYAMSISNGLLFVGEGHAGYRVYEIDGLNLNEIVHDPDITAYDIIAHPSDPNIVLFAGPDGITQYNMDGLDLSLLSQIDY